MPLVPVPLLPRIRLHMAHPGSGLRRLIDPDGEDDHLPPYWAYLWAGGTVLAYHFLACPETVAGRHVLDLGAGSGLVGIAAGLAGARRVTAAETDLNGCAALGLNAAANGIAISILAEDLTTGPVPSVDVIAVGDLFYDPDLAVRVTSFLDRCHAAGVEVLVGDPGRAHLPRSRLRRIVEYKVPDMGDVRGADMKTSAVYAYGPDGA